MTILGKKMYKVTYEQIQQVHENCVQIKLLCHKLRF